MGPDGKVYKLTKRSKAGRTGPFNPPTSASLPSSKSLVVVLPSLSIPPPSAIIPLSSLANRFLDNNMARGLISPPNTPPRGMDVLTPSDDSDPSYIPSSSSESDDSLEDDVCSESDLFYESETGPRYGTDSFVESDSSSENETSQSDDGSDDGDVDSDSTPCPPQPISRSVSPSMSKRASSGVNSLPTPISAPRNRRETTENRSRIPIRAGKLSIPFSNYSPLTSSSNSPSKLDPFGDSPTKPRKVEASRLPRKLVGQTPTSPVTPSKTSPPSSTAESTSETSIPTRIGRGRNFTVYVDVGVKPPVPANPPPRAAAEKTKLVDAALFKKQSAAYRAVTRRKFVRVGGGLVQVPVPEDAFDIKEQAGKNDAVQVGSTRF